MTDCSVPYWWQQPHALTSVNPMTVVTLVFFGICVFSAVSLLCSLLSSTTAPGLRTIWAAVSTISLAAGGYALWVSMHVASRL